MYLRVPLLWIQPTTDRCHGYRVPAVLIFCLTNYHNLWGLTQHAFIISLVPWSGVQAQCSWVLCSGSHWLKSKCQQGQWLSSEAQGSYLCSSVVSRFQFLVIVKTEAFIHVTLSLRWQFSSSRSAKEYLCCFRCLWLLPSLTSSPSFKRVLWLGQPHPTYPLWGFKSTDEVRPTQHTLLWDYFKVNWWSQAHPG